MILKGNKSLKVPTVKAQDALDGQTINIDGKDFLCQATGHCELMMFPLKKEKQKR